MKPVIHVVDDDPAARASLCFLLEVAGFDVAGHDSAEAFLEHADLTAPGCAVVDVRMPGMNGLELQQELNRRAQGLPTIMVTGHGDVTMAVAALKAGAIDFIEKPFDDEALLSAVREALDRAGRHQRERALARSLNERAQRLTDREHDVMDLIVDGLPNKAIAAQLGISIRTVEIHRARVMEKMQVTSLADLIKLALHLKSGSS